MLLSLWGDDAAMNHIFRRFLGGEEGGSGVHITFQDLYSSIVFLAAIYVAGQIAQRVLKMPNLVGEIICGILLGPEVANFIPEVTAWVILGEIG